MAAFGANADGRLEVIVAADRGGVAPLADRPAGGWSPWASLGSKEDRFADMSGEGPMGGWITCSAELSLPDVLVYQRHHQGRG